MAEADDPFETAKNPPPPPTPPAPAGDDPFEQSKNPLPGYLGWSLAKRRPWEETARELKTQFGVDPEPHRQQYELDLTRKKYEGGQEPMWRRMVDATPAGWGFSVGANVAYGRAKEAFNAGKATQDDLEKIASYERLQQIKATESAERQVLRAGLQLPNIAIGAGAGSSLTQAAAAGLGKVGVALPAGGLAGFAGRTAAMPLTNPTLGFYEGATAEAAARGRAAPSAEEVGKSYAHSAVAAAILGQVQKLAAGVPGGRLVQAPVGAVAGSLENEIADAATTALGLSTRYGPMTELLQGKKGDNAARLATNILTNGFFAGLHGGSRERVVEAGVGALNAEGRAGLSADRAAENLQWVHDAYREAVRSANPREEMRSLLRTHEGQPRPAVTRYAETLAESLPEAAPAEPARPGQPPVEGGPNVASRNISEPGGAARNTRPPWEMTADEAKAAGVRYFRTAQGSLYAHANGQTIRVKAPHVGHDAKDTGLKRGSEATYFIDPADAQRVGMWQTSSAGGKRLVVRGDQLQLVSKNPSTGQLGRDGAPIRLHADPALGLSPLELNDRSSQGEGWWRGSHPGSPLTEFPDHDTAHAEFSAAAGKGRTTGAGSNVNQVDISGPPAGESEAPGSRLPADLPTEGVPGGPEGESAPARAQGPQEADRRGQDRPPQDLWERLTADHPDWTPEQKGREAARLADVERRERRIRRMTDETGRVTHELPIPNDVAYMEAEDAAPSAAKGFSDSDGLKALNDTFGYGTGNAMLAAKAEVLKRVGLDAYHQKGDEFLYRGGSPEELRSKLERAQELLREQVFTYTAPDGTTRSFKGAGFSFGVAGDMPGAKKQMDLQKKEREARGERGPRAQLGRIVEVGPGGQDQAGRQDQGRAAGPDRGPAGGEEEGRPQAARPQVAAEHPTGSLEARSAALLHGNGRALEHLDDALAAFGDVRDPGSIGLSTQLPVRYWRHALDRLNAAKSHLEAVETHVVHDEWGQAQDRAADALGVLDDTERALRQDRAEVKQQDAEDAKGEPALPHFDRLLSATRRSLDAARGVYDEISAQIGRHRLPADDGPRFDHDATGAEPNPVYPAARRKEFQARAFAGTETLPRPRPEPAEPAPTGPAPTADPLTARQRRVWDMRNGDSPMTLEAVGKKLGLSRQRVHQIEEEARAALGESESAAKKHEQSRAEQRRAVTGRGRVAEREGFGRLTEEDQTRQKLTPEEQALEDMATAMIAGQMEARLPKQSTAAASGFGAAGEAPAASFREKAARFLQSIRNSYLELAGAMAPRTSSHSEESGNKIARYVSAPGYARELAPVLIDKVIPAGKGDSFLNLVGGVLTEMRLRYMRRTLLAKGDAEGAAEVGTIVGQAPERGGDVLASPFLTEADYRHALADPEVQAAIAAYKRHVVPLMEKNFRAAEGLPDGDPIERETQMPGLPVNLKAWRPGDAQTPGTVFFGGSTGSLTAQKANKLGFARRAKGNAEGYDISLGAIIENSIAKSTELAAKAEMYRALEAAGLAKWGRRGRRPEGFDHELPGVSPPKGTQVAGAGETSLYFKDRGVYTEVRKALDVDAPWRRLPLSGPLVKATLMSLGEVTAHSGNLLTMMFKPGMSPVRLARNALAVVRDTPEVRTRIAELAGIGAAKPKGLETGDQLGGRYNPLVWTGKLLDVLDRSIRLTADDAFESLRKKGLAAGGEQNRRDFVNQLGQYNRRAQNYVVQFARDTGLGPFATAGTNYWVQGLRSLTLGHGLKATSGAADLRLRAEMLGRTVAFLAAVPVANYLLWGDVFGDDNTPLGAVKLGRDEKGKTVSFDLTALTGVSRGMRETGLLAMAEGARPGARARGATVGTSADRAVDDITRSLTHPFEGPVVSFAHTALTGKNAIDFPVAEKAKKGESQAANNAVAALVQANPVVAAAAEVTGLGPTGKKTPWYESLSRQLGRFGLKHRAGPPGTPSRKH